MATEAIPKATEVIPKALASAFILVSAQSGYENEIRDDLLKLEPYVQEASVVYGSYDVVVRASAESLGDLKEKVVEVIRKHKRINTTHTMIIM